MDGLDIAIPDSQTDTNLTILEVGAVTTTSTIPPVLESPPVQIISEMEYPILDRLPSRDITVDEKDYTVIYEQTSYPDSRIFGFRTKDETVNQSKLFQILPSLNRGGNRSSELYRINFKNEDTVKSLIREGEKVVEHSKEIRSKLKSTPVSLNDLKRTVNIWGEQYLLVYQPQETSEYIESAFQSTIKKLERRIKQM